MLDSTVGFRQLSSKDHFAIGQRWLKLSNNNYKYDGYVLLMPIKINKNNYLVFVVLLVLLF